MLNSILFKKVFYSKIISLLLVVTFFVTSTAYGIDLSDIRSLRSPLLTTTEDGSSSKRMDEGLHKIEDGIISSQIGKRAKVKDILEKNGKKYLKIVEAQDESKILGEIELIPIDKFMRPTGLLMSSYPKKEYVAILDRIRWLLNDGFFRADCYIFSENIGDFFGIASGEHNLIAIHSSLKDDPIAIFHEIAHYFIDLELLELRLEEDTLVVLINKAERLWLKVPHKLQGESLAIAQKDPNNPHYLLRALQREMFEAKDMDLSKKILLEQNRDLMEEIRSQSAILT